MRTSTVIGCIACLVLVGCGKDDPNELRVIITSDEYNRTLADAKLLSKAPLEAAAAGELLSEEQKNALIRARALFKSMLAFRPRNGALALGAAKIDNALKDHDAVIKLLTDTRDGWELNLKNSEDREVASYLSLELARAQLGLNKFEEAAQSANEALKLNKNSAEIFEVLASAHIQTKEVDLAKAEIAEGLKLAPGNPRLTELQDLVKMAEGSR
ncbi:MAG: hypothetical protein JST40_08075 [Armatimonadetes bacterium]|nr:hypothetical protein [Armatimonadota bacterium]